MSCEKNSFEHYVIEITFNVSHYLILASDVILIFDY